MKIYQFIQQYHPLFGIRWLLKHFGIFPNAYYNFLKNRKSIYCAEKQRIHVLIDHLYHERNGIAGYRMIHAYLARTGVHLSQITVHKYMNCDLGLRAIFRSKKPNYHKGHAHKIFPNLLKQEFSAERKNIKWCTDFTYLSLSNGSKRYNCSILDLYDRSIVASLTDKAITSDLPIRTLKKSLAAQKPNKRELLLHSDQGSQYTSKEFVDFCELAGIQQSMSKAGYPYDNAPMERYYNTLKHELIYLYDYHTDIDLNRSIEDFDYGWYNHARPHSYNNYKTPSEARCIA